MSAANTPLRQWLRPQPETFPPLLRAFGWVGWRAEPKGSGQFTKVPYCIAQPTRCASSTDPTTWATFDDAVEAYAALPHYFTGIGVVLTDTAGVTCLDLDHVIDDNGQLDTRAETIVERCASWTEKSPSGTGLHVFVLGRASRAVRGNQIEIYSSGRYICMTGHRWPGTPSTLRSQQDYLDHLVAVATAADRPRRPWTGSSVPPPDDLAGALLAKLHRWSVPVASLKRWSDGFLVELVECPWADLHTTGRGGAAVIIHASGAYDFTCLHAHCASRDWRDFRAAMEPRT